MSRRSRQISINTETDAITLPCLQCGDPETRTCTKRAAGRYRRLGYFTQCDRCRRATGKRERLEARRARNLDPVHTITATRRILEARQVYARRAMAAAADVEHPVKRPGRKCFFCHGSCVGDAESRTARFPYCRAHKPTAESRAAGLRAVGR